MWFPTIMYFWIVPALFPAHTSDQQPLSWESFFIKILLGFGALFIFMMILIYLKQESMLYVPKLPF
jgi:hypothetical protein